MTTEEIIIAIVRILGSLPVLVWPFPGAIIAMLTDLSDLFLKDLLHLGGVDDYQSFDKWLDQVYMLAFLIVALRWQAVPRNIAVALYAYRLVGFAAFEATGERDILIAFPNLFEFWFVFVAGLKHFHLEATVGMGPSPDPAAASNLVGMGPSPDPATALSNPVGQGPRPDPATASATVGQGPSPDSTRLANLLPFRYTRASSPSSSPSSSPPSSARSSPSTSAASSTTSPPSKPSSGSGASSPRRTESCPIHVPCSLFRPVPSCLSLFHVPCSTFPVHVPVPRSLFSCSPVPLFPRILAS